MSSAPYIYIRFFLLVLYLSLSSLLFAVTCNGVVIDEQGQRLMYASVYLKNHPEIGTATDVNGSFTLNVPAEYADVPVVISSMGFFTQQIPLSQFLTSGVEVRMQEQPILLTSTTVNATAPHRSKRKRMAAMLRAIYDQMREQSPSSPVLYQVVSNVKMDAEKSSWGMEQMIAYVVQMPNVDTLRSDSIQFVGTSCKRYCDSKVRSHANELLHMETDKNRKRLATSIDSGTIVHRKMWEMSQIDKTVLLDLSDELRRWQSSRPDAQHSLFTYTRKRSFYLGVVKLTEQHHLLVDNNATLQTYANDLYINLFLPISVQIKDAELSWVNLLNMDDEQLQKFRLKKANMHVRFETHYHVQNGVLLPVDKTMHVHAQLEDNKGKILPCEIWADQQVISTKTRGVTPFLYYNKSKKVPRTIVPVGF